MSKIRSVKEIMIEEDCSYDRAMEIYQDNIIDEDEVTDGN